MEIAGVLGMGNSIVELKNGSLLSNDGRVSEDGGKTWSEPRCFGEGISGDSVIRLKSGALALTSPVGYEKGMIWLSNDEGRSWDPGSLIRVPGGPVYELGDTMIQPESGRLLYCWDYNMVCRHPEMEYEDILARGIWKGKTYGVEGHGHFPEFFASGFSYSDDEGKTWQYEEPGNMPSILMGWFDLTGEANGMCGITPCGEASIAPFAPV